MNRKAVKRTKWNPLIIMLAAVASVIVFAPACFAAQGEHGAITEWEYIPADGEFHYYEESADGGYYDVFSSVTGKPDTLKVTYADGMEVECKVCAGDTCRMPWGDEILVWLEDNQNDSSWDDPETTEWVYVYIEANSGSKSAYRKALPIRAHPQESPVESAVYTQKNGVPAMVNGFSNYPGDVFLSEKARHSGDSITIKFNEEAAPIKYVLYKNGKWVSKDGRTLPKQFLRFFCEDEPSPVAELRKGASAGNGFDYKAGRHTVKGSYIGAEMEYYFDVEEDPVESVSFPASPIAVCAPEDIAPVKGDPYTLYISQMIENHRLLPEGTKLTVAFKDGTVRTFAYDQAKGGFFYADGEKQEELPYAEAFEAALKNPGTFKEGVRMQYGTHFGADLEIELRTGHKMTGIKAEEPTYFEEGNTEYFTCSECGRFFRDEKGETEITENSWVIPKLEPEGWKQDGEAITYDASGDTKINDTGKGTVAAVTKIPKEAEDGMIAQIQKADKDTTILLNAKVGEGADQVNSATVQIPTNVVRAAEKAGASFGVDTILGKIELNNEAVGGVVSGNSSAKNGLLRGSSSGVVELSITEDSRTKWDVKYTVGIAADGTKITEPGGETKITIAEPEGSVKDDIIESYYINEDGTEEGLQTVRLMGTVTATTSKMGSYRTTTRRNLTNAKITGIASSYTYTGKALKPKFAVKFKDGTTVAGKYYSVSWSNNKAVGTAKITVKGKGAYCGSKAKSFYINPKKAGKPSLKVGKNKITVTMKSSVSATGGKYYQVQYKPASSGKWKTAAKTSKRTVTIKSLKKGKKYKVRVRAYKGKRKGKYSSTVKSAAVK